MWHNCFGTTGAQVCRGRVNVRTCSGTGTERRMSVCRNCLRVTIAIFHSRGVACFPVPWGAKCPLEDSSHRVGYVCCTRLSGLLICLVSPHAAASLVRASEHSVQESAVFFWMHLRCLQHVWPVVLCKLWGTRETRYADSSARTFCGGSCTRLQTQSWQPGSSTQ